MNEYIFTSESVTKGHPDKVCDMISDAILDAFLKEDKNSRVAIETVVKNNTVVLAGEISSSAAVDIEKTVRDTINSIGYDRPELGFDGHSAKIIQLIDKQSPDIAQGVDDALENRGKSDSDIGAGDQGMMFGYAVNETEELMPVSISLAHKLSRKLTEVRENGTLPYLRPDGKTQVSVRYENGKPVGIDTILISTQHDPDITQEQIKKDLIKYVIMPTLPEKWRDDDYKILINPTGRFVIGGPVGDSGLTGRKIIVDTYGGAAAHGGGAFSGKDPTKVDRSAAYAARYIAKNIVAAGLADKAEIQLAYAIGVARPVSILVNTFGTGKTSDDLIRKAVENTVDLRPSKIIERFDLKRPIYSRTASYGHFGRTDIDLPWERTDLAPELESYLENYLREAV
ncbi:MAG: methionine adenosyltransferase [Clostridia bacterium]|nr:methionine adenosyltransferase [Clostridia bacterium]